MQKLRLINLLLSLALGSHSIAASTLEDIPATYQALHTSVKVALKGGHAEFFEIKHNIAKEVKRLGKEEELKDILSSLLPPPMLVLPDSDLRGKDFRIEPAIGLIDGHEALSALKECMDSLSTLASVEGSLSIEAARLLSLYGAFYKDLCMREPKERKELIDQTIHVDSPYGSFLISIAQAHRILGMDQYGWMLPKNFGGVHHVTSIESVFFKNDDGMAPIRPGLEILAYTLQKLLLGGGLNPVTLFTFLQVPTRQSSDDKVNIAIRKYIRERNKPSTAFFASYPLISRTLNDVYLDHPIQASLTVGTEGFDKFLVKEGVSLDAIDRRSYSLQFVANLLMSPSDYKPDNYRVIEEIVDGRAIAKLIGIDNDNIFEHPITEAGGKFYLNLKSILFCMLSLMEEPLSGEARTHIQGLTPELTLLQWLYSLEKENQRLDMAGMLDPTKVWGPTDHKASTYHLPLKVSLPYVQYLYHKLKGIRQLFQDHLTLTHDSLMRLYYKDDLPIVYEAYHSLHQQYKDPSLFLSSIGSIRKLKQLLGAEHKGILEGEVAVNEVLKGYQEGKYKPEEAIDQIATLLKVDKVVLQSLGILGEIYKTQTLEKIIKRALTDEEKINIKDHIKDLKIGTLPKEAIKVVIKSLDISPSKSSYLWIKKEGTTLPVIELLEFMVTNYPEELKAHMHKSWESSEVLYGLLTHKAPTKIIQVLLEKAPTLINHQDSKGKTILHKLIESWEGNVWQKEMLDLILTHPILNIEVLNESRPYIDIIADGIGRERKTILIPVLIKLLEKRTPNKFSPSMMIRCYKYLCGLPAVEAPVVATTVPPTSTVLSAGAGSPAPLTMAHPFSISDEDIKKAKTAIKQLEERNKDFQFRMAVDHVLPEPGSPILGKREVSTYTMQGVLAGLRALPKTIIEQLFKEETNTIRRINEEGRGTVAIASHAGYTLHFKFFPELPGIEAAVSDLHHRVIGHGTSKSELFRWNEEIEIPIVSPSTKSKGGAGAAALRDNSIKYVKIKNVPILVSLQVEGDLLKHALDGVESKGKEAGAASAASNVGNTIESIEKELDAESLSDMILMAMLVNPEDGKSDNYVFEPFTRADGTTSYRLTCIDNDHAFVPVVTATGKDGIRIQARSILFALDHMKHPIHAKTIKKFIALRVGETLNQWLSKLNLLASDYTKLYEGHTKEAYGFLKDYHSFIGIPFASGTIAHLYNKFIDLQEALRKHPEYSHLDVLMEVEPAYKTRYIRPLFDLPSPKERFKHIEGEAAEVSLTRPLELLKAHGLITTEALFQKILVNDQVGPQKALEELKAYEEELREKDKVFTGGLEHFKKLKTRKTIEETLKSTDFTSMPLYL